MSEWEAAACGYIIDLCSSLSLDLKIIDVPMYAEYNAEFLRRSLSSDAGRLITFARESASSLFLMTAAQYRQVRRLSVGETFVCPEAALVGPLPSLATSIKEFLAGETAARIGGGPDTGWSQLWSNLEKGSKVSAFQQNEAPASKGTEVDDRTCWSKGGIVASATL
jgi:hypothetical protein